MSELTGVENVASETTAGVFELSANTLALLFFALGFVEDYENWKDYPDEVLTDVDIDAIDRFVGVATYEVMNMVRPTPIGSSMMWWTNTAPENWLLCDGASVLRGDYPDLFDVIGTTFGAVDGDHFNLPDMTERSPFGLGGMIDLDIGDEYGETAVSLTISQLPAHDHDFAQTGHTHTITDPGHGHVVEKSNGVAGGTVTRVGANPTGNLTPNASALSNTTGISINSANAGITFHSQGSNAGHLNVHPVLGCNFIIYAGQ